MSQERAFRLLFDRCAADEACQQAYPNLEQDFYTLLEKLDAEPAIVQKTNPFTQKQYDVLVDGNMFINLMFLAFYDSSVIPHLPGLIESMLAGDIGPLPRFMDMLFVVPSSIAWGMHYSLLCSTESVFTDYAQVEQEIAGTQPRLGEGMLNDHRLVLDVCQAWDRDDPGKEENRAVKSSVPALVLAGEFDPVTPPEWGEQTADALKHGYFFEFPGISHGVTWWNDATNGCVNRMRARLPGRPLQSARFSLHRRAAGAGIFNSVRQGYDIGFSQERGLGCGRLRRRTPQSSPALGRGRGGVLGISYLVKALGYDIHPIVFYRLSPIIKAIQKVVGRDSIPPIIRQAPCLPNEEQSNGALSKISFAYLNRLAGSRQHARRLRRPNRSPSRPNHRRRDSNPPACRKPGPLRDDGARLFPNSPARPLPARRRPGGFQKPGIPHPQPGAGLP